MSQSILGRGRTWGGRPSSSSMRWSRKDMQEELEASLQLAKQISKSVEKLQNKCHQLEDNVNSYSERQAVLAQEIARLRGEDKLSSPCDDTDFEKIEANGDGRTLESRLEDETEVESLRLQLDKLLEEFSLVQVKSEEQKLHLEQSRSELEKTLVEQKTVSDHISEQEETLANAEMDEAFMSSLELKKETMGLSDDLERLHRICEDFGDPSLKTNLNQLPDFPSFDSRPVRHRPKIRGIRSLPVEPKKAEPTEYGVPGGSKDISRPIYDTQGRKRQKSISWDEVGRLEGDKLKDEAASRHPLLASAGSLAKNDVNEDGTQPRWTPHTQKNLSLAKSTCSPASVFHSFEEGPPVGPERNGSTGSTSTHSDLLSETSLGEADRASVSSATKRLDFEDAVVVPRASSLVPNELEDLTSSFTSEEVGQDGAPEVEEEEVETDVSVSTEGSVSTEIVGGVASSQGHHRGDTKSLEGDDSNIYGEAREDLTEENSEGDDLVEPGDEVDSKHNNISRGQSIKETNKKYSDPYCEGISQARGTVAGRSDELKGLPTGRFDVEIKMEEINSQLKFLQHQFDEEIRHRKSTRGDGSLGTVTGGAQEFRKQVAFFSDEIRDLKQRMDLVKENINQAEKSQLDAQQWIHDLRSVSGDQSTQLADLQKQINILMKELKDDKVELQGTIDSECQQRLKVEAEIMDLSASVAHSLISRKDKEDESLGELIQQQKHALIDQLHEAQQLKDAAEVRVVNLNRQADQLELICDAVQNIQEVVKYQDKALKLGLRTLVQVLMLSLGIFTVFSSLSEPMKGALVPT